MVDLAEIEKVIPTVALWSTSKAAYVPSSGRGEILARTTAST